MTIHSRGVLADQGLVDRSKLKASDAVDHLRKHFKCEAKGCAYGNKHGNLVENSIKAIVKQIKKLHDPKKKKLESVYIKIFVHDSSMLIDYNIFYPVFRKIVDGLRPHLLKETSLNFTTHHEQDSTPKFRFEGFIVEKELWQ